MKLIFNDVNDAHEWWLNGKRASGLSSLGKKIDNTWNLEQWGLRMTMLGTAMRPDLAEMALAHHDDKQTLGRLVEQAKNHAKANEGANRGTAKHRISERIDLGEEMLLSPAMATFQADYLAALTAHALTVLPEYVERAVLWPDEKWCGRYDRIYGLGTPCPVCGGDKRIADLKGGEGAILYPHSIAIQLTGYAYAPHTAVMRQVGNVAKFEATAFEPHPEGLCRCKGIIMHAPEAGGVAAYEIDLVPEKLDLIRDVLAWQKRAAATIVRPMTVAVDPGRGPVADGGVEAVVAAAASPADPFDGLVAHGDTPSLARRTPKPKPAYSDDDLIDDGTYDAFQKAFKAMTLEQAVEVKRVAGQANDAGHSVSVAQRRSVRRFNIGTALIAWAVAGKTEDDLRASLYLATGHEDVLQPATPVGAAVGVLDNEQAARFAQIVAALVDGNTVPDPATGAAVRWAA